MAVLGTARLGLWQLDRAAQKSALQQSIDERGKQAPLDTVQLARSTDEAQAQQHRRIELKGRWSTDPAHTIFLDNRPMKGRVGFLVVTPLLLDDGSAVLVQRGWQPRDLRDRTITQPLKTPTEPLRLAGRIAPPPARLLEFESDGQGTIRQNLDLEMFALETRLSLRPLSVLQLEPSAVCAEGQRSGLQPGAGSGGSGVESSAENRPEISAESRRGSSENNPVPGCTLEDDGLARNWPEPSTSIDKHYGYAFQWFSLAALVGGLYLWFQLIRPRRQRMPEPDNQ